MRLHRKIFEKEVAKIPIKVFITIFDGVAGDVKNKAYPDDTDMGTFTLKELYDVGDFECDYDLVLEMMGAVIARSYRMIALQIDSSIMADIGYIAKMMVSTDELQERLTRMVVKRNREKNPNFKIDETNKQKLLLKVRDTVTAMFEPKGTLH
jgi:hypothetical protein